LERDGQTARSQVVGNVGMYFAAYRLSQMGWNVMPTSMNVRGIHLLAYDVAADRKLEFRSQDSFKGAVAKNPSRLINPFVSPEPSGRVLE
jgi:hypothetical protein